MKKLLFLSLFFIVITLGYAQDEKDTVIWQESFVKTKKIATKEHKTVLLFFTGSDWCGPCKKLRVDFFKTERFKTIAKESLVLYEADFPRNKNLVTNEQWETNNRLSKKYKITSFPTIVLLDWKGEEIDIKKGYNLMRDPSYHFQFLENALK